MSKRERLEDLGILSEKLKCMYQNELFDIYRGRNKDIPEWWETLDESKKGEFLLEVAYGLSDLHAEIGEMLMIASGKQEDE